MELEKVLTKNYRTVSLNFTEEQINARLEGVNQACEQFADRSKSVDLIKIYYQMECDEGVKDEFVQCFYSADKTFDEENEEEISILAGCVLFARIQDYKDIWLAYSVEILENFYEGKVKEVSYAVRDTIANKTKDVQSIKACTLVAWKKDWEKELVDEDGEATTTTAQATVNMLKNIKSQFNKVVSYSNSLLQENQRCEEKINVLSWIVGGWSNFLKKPLAEIEDIEGILIVGMELAELVIMPGPFAAEGVLTKMLRQCKSTCEEISLTAFVDGQREEIKQYMVDNFGDEADEINHPITSAIKGAMLVDEKRAWVSAYRKKWKINPDDVTFSLNKWAKLVYLECMISK